MGCPVWNTWQRTRQGLQCCTSCFLIIEHDSRKGRKESGMHEGTNYTGLHEPTLDFYHIFKDFPSSPCFRMRAKYKLLVLCSNIWTTTANITLRQASFSVLLGCYLHTTFQANMSSHSFHTEKDAADVHAASTSHSAVGYCQCSTCSVSGLKWDSLSAN